MRVGVGACVAVGIVVCVCVAVGVWLTIGVGVADGLSELSEIANGMPIASLVINKAHSRPASII
jgi:hypothetical protein